MNKPTNDTIPIPTKEIADAIQALTEQQLALREILASHERGETKLPYAVSTVITMMEDATAKIIEGFRKYL
jgi:hypothetical protein